jgi:hypothetical protein
MYLMKFIPEALRAPNISTENCENRNDPEWVLFFY